MDLQKERYTMIKVQINRNVSLEIFFIYQIRSNIFQQKISIIIAPTTKTPQKSITTARTIATIEPGTIILWIEINKNFIINAKIFLSKYISRN